MPPDSRLNRPQMPSEDVHRPDIATTNMFAAFEQLEIEYRERESEVQMKENSNRIGSSTMRTTAASRQ